MRIIKRRVYNARNYLRKKFFLSVTNICYFCTKELIPYDRYHVKIAEINFSSLTISFCTFRDNCIATSAYFASESDMLREDALDMFRLRELSFIKWGMRSKNKIFMKDILFQSTQHQLENCSNKIMQYGGCQIKLLKICCIFFSSEQTERNKVRDLGKWAISKGSESAIWNF